MKYPKNLRSLLLLLVLFGAVLSSCSKKREGNPKVLVFSKTAGYYHESIPKGIAAIQKLGTENGFTVDTTSNAELFNEENLAQYATVIFLSTTGDVLNHYQEADFERYIQSGGGFVGIHAAADTEYGWGWYGRLVGGYFADHPGINDPHPNVQPGKVTKTGEKHPSTDALPDSWTRTDEWYSYKKMNPNTKKLLLLDETSYQGGLDMGEHPIAWYHDFDGGRAFYTGGGHTNESYEEADFLKHLLAGIQYTIGENLELNYKKATSQRTPEENRFTKTSLSMGQFTEPTEMTILPNLDILVAQRRGEILQYNQATGELKEIIKRFVSYFIGQWKLIAIITIITSSIGLIYGKLQPSSYKATATFIVEDKSGSRGGGLSGLASQFGIDVGGLTGGGAGLFDGDNILEIMQSRAIIEKVLLSKIEEDIPQKGQTIADYYFTISGMDKSFAKKNINAKTLNFSALEENSKHTLIQDSVLYLMYTAINKNLNVEKKNKKSSIITLEVSSSDQVFSKIFEERLMKKTSDLYIDIKTGNLSRSIEKIQRKADSLESSLTGIYKKSFELDNTLKLLNANTGIKINTSSSEAATRDKTVSNTLYAEVVKNLETLKLSLINQMPVIQVLDAPKFPLFDQRTPARYFMLIGFAIGFVISLFYTLYKYTEN